MLALGSEAARTQRNMTAVLILALSVFTVVSFGNIFIQGKYMCTMLVVLLLVSIMANVSYQYSYEKDYLSEFSDSGKALEKLESGADKAVPVSYTHLDVYKRQMEKLTLNWHRL